MTCTFWFVRNPPQTDVVVVAVVLRALEHSVAFKSNKKPSAASTAVFARLHLHVLVGSLLSNKRNDELLFYVSMYER